MSLQPADDGNSHGLAEFNVKKGLIVELHLQCLCRIYHSLLH